jgi:hypothetical protein
MSAMLIVALEAVVVLGVLRFCFGARWWEQ